MTRGNSYVVSTKGMRWLRMRRVPRTTHTAHHGIKRGTAMTIDRIVLAFAGAMVLLSLLLSYLVNPWWLGLAGFVGVNLFQAAFTGFCPLAMILKKLGAAPGAAFS